MIIEIYTGFLKRYGQNLGRYSSHINNGKMLYEHGAKTLFFSGVWASVPSMRCYGYV